MNHEEYLINRPYEEASALLASRLRELERSTPTSRTSTSRTSDSTLSAKDTSPPVLERNTRTLETPTGPLTYASYSLQTTRSTPSPLPDTRIGPTTRASDTQSKLSPRNGSAHEILTYRGHYINPAKPDPEKIDIEDIAHALSNMCRFGGHCPVFYSVAEHSILVHDLVKSVLSPAPSVLLAALLHDAEEAYMVDIPTPLKRQFPDYKAAGERLGKVIMTKYGCADYVHNEAIKEADEQAYYLERGKLWRGANPQTMSSRNAEWLFLKVFHEYR